jgi:lysophospholipase L1-like esterase
MKKLVALFAVALLFSVAVIGISVHDGMRKSASGDPRVWEDDIRRFEAADRDNPPPPDAILFVGSSSIRLWHTLAEDMAPLTTIRRGVGGARMEDIVYYADRLITPYAPAKVVLFVGTNDINLSDEPMAQVPGIGEGLGRLITAILKGRADTDIYYIAITPSIMSWHKWDAVQAANAATESVCAASPRCTFIVTAELFLDEAGQPRKKLYQFDGLHLSDKGYALWTRRIRPYLEN